MCIWAVGGTGWMDSYLMYRTDDEDEMVHAIELGMMDSNAQHVRSRRFHQCVTVTIE